MPSANITTKWLESLKTPASGRVEYFDKKTGGLCLRMSESGARTWYLLYRLPGDRKKYRYKLGEYDPDGYDGQGALQAEDGTTPPINLKGARALASAKKVDIGKGQDPSGKRREHKESPTVAALAHEYLERWAKPRKRSWREDERILNFDVLPAWGERKARDIKRRDVRQLLETVAARGAGVMANRTLACVRRMFNWGVEQEIVPASPAYRVKPVAVETQRDRVLTEAEIKAVWEKLDKAKMEPITRAALRLILATAQRPGEVAGMAWSEIDVDKATWTIPAERSKNKLAHTVPLNAVAVGILKSLPRAKAPCVFVSTWHGDGATPLKVGVLSRALKDNLAVLGVKGIRPHDFRRTAATCMASAGVSRLVISKLLNHVETGITAVYDRASYDREKRDAVDTWGEELARIIKGEKSKVVALPMAKTA